MMILLAAKVSDGVSGIVVVFAVFHSVYGLAGPLAALTGAPLPWVYSQPYAVEPFLVNLALATLGFALPLALKFPERAPSGSARLRADGPALFALGLAGAALASLMEMVNLFRVGGLATLVRGKAYYQSAATELTLTLPSEQVALLATALFGLSIAIRRAAHESGQGPKLRPMLGTATFLLLLGPVLSVMLVLGQRGPLLGFLITGLLAVWYDRTLKLVRIRVLVMALIVYVSFGVLYAYRAILGGAFVTGQISVLKSAPLDRSRLLVALNPAGNEFGAPFGNFSEFFRYGDEAPRLGSTYLRSLLYPIPGFLYPGRKPQQIGYEFRDRLFPSTAQSGSIAGTAYSSILEAYMNFRETGVLLLYVLYGVTLIGVERWRRASRSLGSALLYLLMVPSMVQFHRSAFGDMIVIPGVFALGLVALTLPVVEIVTLLRRSAVAAHVGLAEPDAARG